MRTACSPPPWNEWGAEGTVPFYPRKQGKTATAVLGTAAVDLVRLDVRMPGIGGIETLLAIKADPALRAIPVVMLTASTLDEDVLRGYTEQASAYLIKPIDIDSLRAVVQRLEQLRFALVVAPRPDR